MHTNWLSISKKMVAFAFVGGLGCLLAAIVGELFLFMTRLPAPPLRANAICLLLDTSGSMSGSRMEEMKAAAKGFVSRWDLTDDRLAIVTFDSQATVQVPLTNDRSQLQTAIESMRASGWTAMAEGLRVAAGELAAISDMPSKARYDKSILLFTDGIPTSGLDGLNPKESTLSEAADCREAGIAISSVATAEAEVDFLAQVTLDPNLVFYAATGGFDEAFRLAEQVIGRRIVIGTEETVGGFAFSVFRMSFWTSLLSVGVSLALIAGQNYYLQRLFLRRREAIKAALCALAAGAVAGGLAQIAFSVTTGFPDIIVESARLVSWAILGALLGFGVAFFVPNLKPSRGAVGGVIGGAAGGIGFIIAALLLDDVAGRWFGAASVGLCIGAMIVWAEAVFREAWLEVRYGPKEKRTVSLGYRPVSIGSDREKCMVYVHGALPVALRYTLREGRIQCEDPSVARICDVRPGDARRVGTVDVVVCALTEPLRTTEESSTSSTKQHARRETAEGKVRDHGATTDTQSGPSDVMVLRLPGKRIPLPEGVRLKTVDLSGLETTSADHAVAEVIRNHFFWGGKSR